MIPFLKRLKFGQFVRDDGPESHLKKSGTPTMGGIIILLSIILTSLLYIGKYQEIIPVLFATVGFGLIGFLDDYIKVVMKRSMGLRAWQKLVGQILVTSIFGYYLVNYTNVGSTMLIPFTGGFLEGKFLDTSYLFVPLLFLVVLGTVNGANFTDGLDGLASSVTLLIATFFSVVAIGVNSGISPITCAVAGSLLSFLLYNVYPARVFMGDPGSLALGGFVAASAYMLRMPLFILIVGLVYLVEVLSVILQVGYFKLSGGKRIFKMAPIHHHFELCGWPETRVVGIFSIVTTVLCIVALMAI
jgi:phospho-N-acetylmuramoyl-pentapeptide-transferase